MFSFGYECHRCVMFSEDAPLMSKSSSHILVLGWYDSGKITESSVFKKCVFLRF